MPLDFTVSGNGGKAPTPPASGGKSTGLDFSLGAGSKGTSAPKNKNDMLLGINLPKLPKFLGGKDLPTIGMHVNAGGPSKQLRDMIVQSGPNLVRLGGTLYNEAKAGHAQGGLAGALSRSDGNVAQAVNPLSKSNLDMARAVQPTSYQLLKSPAQTVRQIPDTIGAIRPGGVGFGQSDLGRQIKEEGVVSTGLAKLADVSMLAGGVGVIGKAAGTGRLAEASRLEGLVAKTAEAAKLGKGASAFDITKAAVAAEAGGDVARAEGLYRAVGQLNEASKLRTAVAGAGKGVKVAEKVTAGAAKTAHLGGRVAAAPFVPTEKALGLVGKGIGAAARLERVAPYVERAQEALHNVAQKKAVDDLFHETVRTQLDAELHDLFQRHGIEDAARGMSADEQAAIYISKAKQGLTPKVRAAMDAVETLPEEVRPDVIKAAFGDAVTPEQYRLARQFEDGTLPESQQAKMRHAADALSEVQGRRERNIYVTGEGTSRELSDEALANRRARAEGRSAPADVEAAKDTRTPTVEQTRAGQNPRKVSTLKQKLTGVRAELDEMNTRTEPVAPVAPSRAQDRRLAAKAERTRRAEATVKGETERGTRLMESAGKEVERTATRASNRTGQVIGRARGRLEEADQLQTGVERRAKQAELKAQRLAKVANATEDNAAKLVAADEARAESNKIKGVKSPDLAKVKSDVNLDAQRANVANRAESGTANRLLGKQVEEQRGAVAKAQKKLDAAQSEERSTRDRFERENQVRADRAEQKRFDTLHERESKALNDIAKAEEEARNSIEAAPPQDRPALQTNYRVKNLMLDLAESHPERATEFKALADDIETTKAALDAAGVKTEYFFGGKPEDRMATVPPTAKLRTARKLQSERTRRTGTLQRDIRSQTEKYAKEIRDVLYNKFRGHLDEGFGSTIGEELSPDRFATGEELAAQLGENKLVAWDPKTGTRITDPKLIDAGTRVLPEALYDKLTSYTGSAKGGAFGKALRVYDAATGKWKHSVLALSPRWHIGNIVGNAAMATLGAGLSPAQIAANIGEARRLVKDFEEGKPVPARHEAALRRLLSERPAELGGDPGKFEQAQNRLSSAVRGEGTSRVRNAAANPISKSYSFNSYVDNVNRTMIYLAKNKTGVSSEAAVQLALKAAGDFNKMTPFERQVVRRVIPFYAWQRHITRLAFSLPIEAPARVAWTLHLAELESRLNPDPGKSNEFNEGTIPFGKKRLNVNQFFPFTSSFWTDPTFRGAGYQVNPLLKAGVAGATGFNLGKMKMTSGKFQENPSGFGASPSVLAAKHPQAFAAFLGQQVPQVGLARDLVAGKTPVRYDTGEPRKVGKGASKKTAKPTLTGQGRKETIAKFLGVPIAVPEQKATSKKK